MPLGVVSRVSFGFGMIFGEKSQKGKTRKIWAKRVPTPQRGVPSPWRGRDAKMAPPWVRYGIALLCRSGGLRRGVDTIHNEKIF